MINAMLGRCPLFAGIAQEEISSLLNCLTAREQAFRKDAFVFRVDDPALFVGVVLTGSVNVIQEDFWGNRTILTHIEAAGLFGEAFSCAEIEKLPVSVIAAEASDIMLIDYRKIINTCSNTCLFHTKLISNMLRILAVKNRILTQKMEHISKRTTREKLLSFLSAEAMRAKSNTVTLPYNRQDLADFLCVERSALSRELSLMKKDGLLDYDKNRFVLL